MDAYFLVSESRLLLECRWFSESEYIINHLILDHPFVILEKQRITDPR